MQSNHYQIIVVFIEELQEQLTILEQGLRQLPVLVRNPEAMHQLSRAAHSLKGGASMLKLAGIQWIAHQLEDVFRGLQHHPVKVDSTIEALLWQAFLGLSSLAAELEGTFDLSTQTTEATLKELKPIFVDLNHHLTCLREPLADTASPPYLVPSTKQSSRPNPLLVVLRSLRRNVGHWMQWLCQQLGK